jgi:hypothetical protein
MDAGVFGALKSSDDTDRRRQKLSGLMAQMDERLDEPEPPTSTEALAFRAAIEALIGPSEEGDMEFL